jgi:outer membrane protein assembly factor BamA
MLSRRLLTGFVLLIWWAVPSFAQLPKRLERCLPNPTLAQEIRDMQKEVEPQKVTLHVARIEFDPKSGIPLELQREITEQLKGRTFEEDEDTDNLKEAANEIAEVVVRGSLQNKGYFRVLPDAKLTALKAEGSNIEVAAAVSAELGPQYRVGKVEVTSADPDKWLSLKPEVLREEFRFGEGDFLNVDAIRTALRKLTKIYGKFGFIDMTAEPVFKIDDTQKIVDLTIHVDEQKQYYVKEVRFLGVDQKLEEKLKAALPRSTGIFDSGLLEEFFKKNRNILPSNASLDDDVEFHRNTKEGTVSMVFDFRPCPGQEHR